VFLLCDLRRGASWNFFIWDLCHGAFLIAERLGMRQVLLRVARQFYLIVVVIVGWVPFRVDSLDHAVAMLRGMAGIAASPEVSAGMPLPPGFWIVLLLGAIHSVWPRGVLFTLRGRVPQSLRQVAGLAGLAILIGSTASLAAGTYKPFIYFRF